MMPTADKHSDKLRDYYRLHSRIYDLTRWSFLFGRNTILDNLPELPPQPRILEIGCGTGSNIETMEYLFPDARIYGVDLSQDMLEKAKAKVAHTGQVTLLNKQYGAESTDLRPFDLILLSYTLTMTGNQVEQILQQIADDLKPEGYIAVVDFHTSPFAWFRSWMKANHVDLDGFLLPLLRKYFRPHSIKVDKAYFGLWSYFLFLGRRS